MNKEEKIKVFEDTVKIAKKGEYLAPNGNTIKIEFEDKMLEGTKFYGRKAVVDYDNIPRYDTDVKVVNNDCLYEALNLIGNGLNPCVLNMASFITPGGGVTRGSSAQEENIFRRTNIYKSLFQFHYVGDEYGVKQREERYPLEHNFGGIYTPCVTVFKGSDDVDYKLLDNPYLVNVVSVPAVKNPRVENGKIVPWAVDIIKNKIRQIFDIALEHKHDSLVLSAFGCGAYGTPPEQMAKFFYDTINSTKYKGAFKVIRFAIINLPSTNGRHNPNGNIKPFEDVFNK